MDPYKPIACALYDRYERAILTRSGLTISWREGDLWREDKVLVLALETAEGQEFLGFEDTKHRRHRVRLDAIHLLD